MCPASKQTSLRKIIPHKDLSPLTSQCIIISILTPTTQKNNTHLFMLRECRVITGTSDKFNLKIPAFPTPLSLTVAKLTLPLSPGKKTIKFYSAFELFTTPCLALKGCSHHCMNKGEYLYANIYGHSYPLGMLQI